MHEFSLIKNLIESIERDLAAKGVGLTQVIREVTIRVGSLEIHSREACRQAFQMLSRGTRLDGAELKLEVVPARVSCPKCECNSELSEGAADGHEVEPIIECPSCGSTAIAAGGRGVETVEVRIKD